MLAFERQIPQHVQERHAAGVAGQAMRQVEHVEARPGQAGTRGDRLRARDLAGIDVHAQVRHRLPIGAQGVGEQAQPAAQVQQRRLAAAQRRQRARIQRIGAQLGLRVVVVVAIAVPALGQEGAGDARGVVAIEGAGVGGGV